MAGAKEIRTKIKSIQSTQKITKAMEMVAASKMRKAQERMKAARPYATKIRNVISHLAHAHTEYRSPGLTERDLKRVGLIVVSTDRGLCGGLNTNLFKATILAMQDWRKRDIEIDICTVGTKAFQFFRRLKGNIVAHVSHLGDSPRFEDVLGPVKVMADAFAEGKVDAIYLVYNEFVNTMSQKPRIERLMPITAEVQDAAPHHRWDYIYEPDPKDLIELLLRRYSESVVYQSLVENVASEMAARMVAMKSASDNAGTLIDELQLIYNKARQASITQELAEIVGGAAAV
ncbi:MAG: F0F1 ATP synthase subunit gamma [Candidatus Competibacter denitrificans]|jgi:F-type H+-transporting ATPase subunit gamma|uniref:ATP synthase gamma chain n=1 Tax=Candidatus Competibacter denitrificans Run_A_D11 TaxID=1400863 RepID=W6MBB7_9GAMM|nr:F0F1 ATP synthase subunit gamma [Candidatus Competibacter denitrificans]CDI01203.1 ATP synthase, F1 sector, gamma-subunit [Candidatus Competibacter denitrificans Run_A_D11]HRC70588.1 F0F1 ATP synthase subunit gamma [Candidatus Competibacter denitrificans]HRC70807.1 F0F1 ATP synthase subunit gamma [Candidatus Competibacter denitrificans]